MLREMLAEETAALVADDGGFAESCWIDGVEVRVVANERDAFRPTTDSYGRRAERAIALLAPGAGAQAVVIEEGTAVFFRDRDWKVESVDFRDEVCCRFNIGLHEARRYAGSKAIKS